MERSRIICLKRIVIGFVVSCLAVSVTVWAMMTYVPQSSPIFFAIGAAFATFYCMTFTMRAAIRESYHAGEVGRRLPVRRSSRTDGSSKTNTPKRIPARTLFSAADDSMPPEAEHRETVASSSFGD